MTESNRPSWVTESLMFARAFAVLAFEGVKLIACVCLALLVIGLTGELLGLWSLNTTAWW